MVGRSADRVARCADGGMRRTARQEGGKKLTGWDICLLQRGDIPISLWMGLGGWNGEKDRKGLEGEGSLR